MAFRVKLGTLIALLLMLGGTIAMTAPIESSVEWTPDAIKLTWITRLNCHYQVETSADLENWVDLDVVEIGTGGAITHSFERTAEKKFYRVLENTDPYNGEFLTLPNPHQEVDVVDGVCFAFNLENFDPLPAKIRIYQRANQPGSERQLIGSITEFAERKGVKFVRGSVVWIPPGEGSFEVQAVAVDEAGVTLDSAVRQVSVGANRPPSITITGLTGNPPLPSAVPLPMSFELDLDDDDGDAITRVEFFDKGVWIGTDREAPFGRSIFDAEGLEYLILKGGHSITAKAYDSRGAVAETAQAFQVEITEGNARPTLELVSPTNELIVTSGQTFTLTLTVADPDGDPDLLEVRATNLRNLQIVSETSAPLANLDFDTTGWTFGTHTIVVRAFDQEGETSYPIQIMVTVQEATEQTFAEWLVANLVDPFSVHASNESFDGEHASSGVFEAGLASGLQMDEGILLSTGLFSFWNGGNHWGNRGLEWHRSGDDRLRDRLSDGAPNYTTHDAASLEFDLFCENGQLEFEFQFGSEEYLEYVGQFNDGFMITVDDVIVSLVPDGEGIVSVNLVHPAISAAENHQGVEMEAQRDYLYLDNTLDIAPHVDPSNSTELIEYDGMVVKLRGHVLLEPNRTYRVRMIIADANDWALDSVIFVQKNSLRTIAPLP